MMFNPLKEIYMANGFDEFNQERAFDTAAQGKYEFNGAKYSSLRAACNATGADYYRVRRRVAQGWSLQDAIAAPTYARRPLDVEGATIAKIALLIQEREHDRALIMDVGRAVAQYLASTKGTV
jgi:hypothetical protein